MIDSPSNNQPMEAVPIPEGAVALPLAEGATLKELAIAALKKTLEIRNLDLPLNTGFSPKNLNQLLKLNHFAVQVVATGFTSDQITIPLKPWFKKGSAPQLLLIAQVDDENNVVHFPGALTAEEFVALVSSSITEKQNITIPIEKFSGGVDRLLRFVRFLELSAISQNGLAVNQESSLLGSEISKKIKATLSIAALLGGALIVGPEIFRPRLSLNLASLPINSIKVSSSRSALSSTQQAICLLSPAISDTESKAEPTAEISIDQPLIFSLTPLSEISIFRNGQIAWSEIASPGKSIQAPISWPIEPIESGQEYSLRLRPKGTSIGEQVNLKLRLTTKQSLLKITPIISSLGKNESLWVKTINRKLKQDSNLALALLFSEDAPKIKTLNFGKQKLSNINTCSE
ncbi:hypothetical protein [Prochlorococcus sp. MIT 1341]|uniref:hypothetical protein n=1 Tax=Prochlorococcus sp. MIT 1341 TaxID=3096221 RepID=UPI002A7642CA|nr:hypothetical protein [Prochlorococcus sp. MIT 1341]